MADALQLQFPAATANDCERFWTSFGSDAGRLLGEYLDFKTNAERDLADVGNDASSLWLQCMKVALLEHPLDDAPEESSSIFDPVLLVPTTSDGTPIRCAEGKRILYVAPARVNFDLYPPEVYTACILLFCYKSLGDGNDPVTVLVDVRAGRGWANMPITRMYGWLRTCATALSQRFPGVLHKCIVFTIPFVAKALWYVVQPLLAAEITESLVLVKGSGTSPSTPLPDDMFQHVPLEHMQSIEETRKSWFIPPPSIAPLGGA